MSNYKNRAPHMGTAYSLQIATGILTLTNNQSFIAVQVETGSTDDLVTINGGKTGQLIVLKAKDSAETVVFKDGTGNLQLAGDFSLTHKDDTMTLIRINSTDWLEISRSDNTA